MGISAVCDLFSLNGFGPLLVQTFRSQLGLGEDVSDHDLIQVCEQNFHLDSI